MDIAQHVLGSRFSHPHLPLLNCADHRLRRFLLESCGFSPVPNPADHVFDLPPIALLDVLPFLLLQLWKC